MKSLAIHTECAVNFNLGDAEPDVPRPVPVGDGQITYELKSRCAGCFLAKVRLSVVHSCSSLVGLRMHHPCACAQQGQSL